MFLKRLIVFSLIAVLVIGAMILVYVFVIRDNTRWNLIEVGNSAHSVSDFSNSRMHLYGNGVFTVEIIYNDTPMLTGTGTWVRDGNVYTFNYIDKWIRSGNQMIRLGQSTGTYNRVGQRIRFTDTHGNAFYFR